MRLDQMGSWTAGELQVAQRHASVGCQMVLESPAVDLLHGKKGICHPCVLQEEVLHWTLQTCLSSYTHDACIHMHAGAEFVAQSPVRCQCKHDQMLDTS